MLIPCKEPIFYPGSLEDVLISKESCETANNSQDMYLQSLTVQSTHFMESMITDKNAAIDSSLNS